MNQHPLYWVWINMIRRCTNPTEKSYARYGGRGIKVCDRWNILNNFVADMGERPAGTTLDRIDNSGDYCKDNCKWSTRHEQGKNTRTNVHITIDDRTMIYSDWVRESGLPETTVRNRINRGWTIKESFGLSKRVETPHPFLPKGWARMAKNAGLRHGLVHSRVVYMGWTFERAISTPPITNHSQYQKHGSARIPSTERKALGVKALR
jgi:hypothetical protein